MEVAGLAAGAQAATWAELSGAPLDGNWLPDAPKYRGCDPDPSPTKVEPRDRALAVRGGALTLTLAPMSVNVVRVGPAGAVTRE